MNRWVHLVSGPYHFLLNAEQVREIRDGQPGGGAGGRGRWREWRGRLLPVIDCHAWLGLPGMSGGGLEVIYTEVGRPLPVILTCDRVVRVEWLEESAFIPLPPLLGRFSQAFDRARLDVKSGIHALRCCRPLPESLFADAEMEVGAVDAPVLANGEMGQDDDQTVGGG